MRINNRNLQLLLLLLLIGGAALSIVSPSYIKNFNLFSRAEGMVLNQMDVYTDTLQNQFVLTQQPGNPPSTCLATYSNPDHFSGQYSMELNLNHFCTTIFTKPNDATFPSSNYTDVEFDMKGVLPLFTQFGVSLNDTHYSSIGTDVLVGGDASQYQITNSWQHIVIPITAFNIADDTQISGISFRSDDNPQTFLGNILIDNLRFVQRADTTPPTVVSVQNSDLTHLTVTFSERVNASDANNSANYVLKTGVSGDPYSGTGKSPTSASLSSTQKDVTLTFPSAMTNGRTYTLVLNNIHDLAQTPNVIAGNTSVNVVPVVQNVTFNINAAVGPNNGPIRVFSPLLRGAGTALWMHTFGKPFFGAIPVLNELSKQAKIGLTRNSGGNWANAVTWARGTDPNGIQYTSAMMDSLAQFKQYTGGEVMIQINICNNNPSMWADMLRYTNVEHNYNFKYWEIGSENNYDTCDPNPGRTLTAQEVASRYLTYRNALLAVDPTIIAVGPATAGFGGDAEQPGASDDLWWPLITQAHQSGRNLDGLSWHWYLSNEGYPTTGCGAEYGASIPVILNYNTALTNCYSYQPGQVIDDDHNFIMSHRRKFPEIGINWIKNLFLAPNGSSNTLVGLTEINTLAGAGTVSPSALEGNHVAALWFADMLGRLGYAGYDFNTMYNLYDGTHYSMIYTNNDVDPYNDIHIRPSYYTMFMYGNYFGDRMVQSSTSDTSQKVTVWAAKDSHDPNKLTLMVTNLTGTSYNAGINVAGYTPQSGVYYELTNPSPLEITDASATDASGTSLNGATINTTSVAAVQNSINQIPSRSLGSVGSQFTHAFPPYSVTAIVLSTQPGGFPTNTPVPSGALSPTATPFATPTLLPSVTPTAVPTGTVGQQLTVTFNDYPTANPGSGDKTLTGQYPSGVITWGSNWITSDPWAGFTTRNLTFYGSTTSASFTLVNPMKVVSLKATTPYGSTVTFSCSGQPTVSRSVAASSSGYTLLTTGWTGPCTTVTIASSNGNATNFDDLVLESGSSVASPTPTRLPTPTPTSTLPTPTRTPTPSTGPTRTPTPTPTSTTGTQTVTFNNLNAQNQSMATVNGGQYPTNVISWGSTSNFILSPPWNKFTTNSISYRHGATDGTFTFITRKKLVKIEVYNGGYSKNTVRISCSGQPTVSYGVGRNVKTTILTRWSGTCTTVTLHSDNSDSTNWDNIVYE
jgi:hypothetical protein